MFNPNAGLPIARMPIAKIAAAAAISGLIVFLTSWTPEANDADIAAKANRLAIAVKGAACSLQGWPNFEPSCQFDLRKPATEAKAVRVLALR
jgi:hypothetical protein